MTIDRIGKGGAHYAHFTPEAGADILASAIPEHLILQSEFGVLDLCAGSGSLVVAVIRRALALGVDPMVLRDRVGAVELDPEYVNQCNWRVSEYLGEGDWCTQGDVLSEVAR